MNEHQVRMSQAEPDEGAMHLEGYMLGFRDAEGQLQCRSAQSRKMSLAESVTNSVVGIGLSIGMSFVVFPIVFGFMPTITTATTSTAIFTVISIIRSYVMRRLFTWLHHVKGIN